MTTWKPVGFGWGDLYEVCAEGHVRRIGTTRNLGVMGGTGYVRVHFSRNGTAKLFAIHKVVADAFIGPRPDSYHIDHINGIRHDNRAENLRYCTSQQNVAFTVERGAVAAGERHGMSVFTYDQVMKIRKLKKESGRYWGAAKIARELGVSLSAVHRVAKGRGYSGLPASAIRREDLLGLW